MAINNFHFAQPAWLWAVLLIPLGWAWIKYCQYATINKLNFLHKFIDQQLLPHLLVTQQKNQQQNWLYLGYVSLILSIVIALANPRWDYEEIDAYAPVASMVILLDLSSTMNASDVAPSRIVRARQNIEDILNSSKGLKVGLIGYAAIPHLISPITDDIQTVKAFLPAVDTDLVKKQGNNLALALNAASDLLQAEPAAKKSILLVSDGNFADLDYAKQLKTLVAENICVFVMGVGTMDSGTYDQAKLQRIAKAGQGLYVATSHSNVDIEKILNRAQHLDKNKHVVSGKIKQWEGRYYWLLVPAAIVYLFLLSHRAFYVFSLIFILGIINSPPVVATELPAIFKNSEQQAQQAYTEANFTQAAELFKDPYRKGVALYRAGEYAAAEQQFKTSKRADVKIPALYNAGNAQMQQKKWQAAIKSYKQVLAIEPEHADAAFNLALAEKMLAEQGPESEQEQEDNQDQDQEDKQDQKSNQDQENNKEQEDKQEQEDNQQQPEGQQSEQQQVSPEDDERAQQWLNRIDSDVKVFLKNKFYIEDMLSSK